MTVKDNGVKEENNPVQRVRVRDPSALGGDWQMCYEGWRRRRFWCCHDNVGVSHDFLMGISLEADPSTSCPLPICGTTWSLNLPTPCYKKSILGAKWTISGINFFCRFLLRLSENNHSRVMFMAKFGPTASNFGYEILMIFWVEIRAFSRPHVWSWTGFDLLTISGVKFWWFSFFYFLSRPSRTRVRPV